MATSKSKKSTKEAQNGNTPTEPVGDITSAAELKSFLLSLRDRMTDGQAAPIYAFTAMNHLLSKSEIYSLFDSELKELGRDIWLRLKQSGIQMRNPAFLFGHETAETPVP